MLFCVTWKRKRSSKIRHADARGRYWLVSFIAYDISLADAVTPAWRVPFHHRRHSADTTEAPIMFHQGQ